MRSLYILIVAIILTGCRATSRTSLTLRTDSLSSATIAVRADSIDRHTETIGYDSVVTLTFDTLGHLVSQTTAIHRDRQKTISVQNITETIERTYTRASSQKDTTENTKSPPTLTLWQRIRPFLIGLIAGCLALYVYITTKNRQ